jgi:hypothetical protein
MHVAERWKMAYNRYRPHRRLDYKVPAACAATCFEHGAGFLRLIQDKENCGETL